MKVKKKLFDLKDFLKEQQTEEVVFCFSIFIYGLVGSLLFLAELWQQPLNELELFMGEALIASLIGLKDHKISLPTTLVSFE